MSRLVAECCVILPLWCLVLDLRELSIAGAINAELFSPVICTTQSITSAYNGRTNAFTTKNLRRSFSEQEQ